MARDAAKTQDSNALDRQVEAMARAAGTSQDPGLESQLDDLLATAPNPDHTLGSLDRQLAALTAELLDGDFADSNDALAGQAVSEAPPMPAGDTIAADRGLETPLDQPLEAASEPSRAVDDSLPAAAVKQHVEMSLEEQMAAFGADLLEGDFESASGDVVGSTQQSKAENTPPIEAPVADAAAADLGKQAEGVSSRGGDGPAPDSEAPVAIERAASAAASAPGAGPESGSSGPAVEPISEVGSAGFSVPEQASQVPGAGATTSPREVPAPQMGAPAPVAAPRAGRQGPAWHVRVGRAIGVVLRRTEPAARQAAAIASKPLDGRPPVIRQTVGWLAIWTAFLAICAIMASVMFRAPSATETDAPPTELIVPEPRETLPPAPRAGENLRGRPIPPP